nr:phage tail family protein [Lactococcus lactis]
MADGTILKDNIPSATEKLNNSKFFSIPPGESTVEISSSSWNNVAPDVEVSWEEVFL